MAFIDVSGEKVAKTEVSGAGKAGKKAEERIQTF
jgi:hypothetical protein